MDVSRITLDLKGRSAETLEFESQLKSKIVGQNEAVYQFVNVYQTFLAGWRPREDFVGD